MPMLLLMYTVYATVSEELCITSNNLWIVQALYIILKVDKTLTMTVPHVTNIKFNNVTSLLITELLDQ